MGQAKRKLRRLLDEQALCCFCGGANPATTMDHQPARSLFDERQWPEGYEFPACDTCNQKSKHAEHILALLVRINSQNEDDPVRRREFQKYVHAMHNNFPRLLTFLTANQKRDFLKSEGYGRVTGSGLAGLHMAGIDAQTAEQTFEIALDKLFRALHYKHTGLIPPVDSRTIVMRWFTNAYVHYLDDPAYVPFRSLPARPAIVRNGRDLSEQFGYRYGLDKDSPDISAFLVRFRYSIMAIGIVVQRPESLNETKLID